DGEREGVHPCAPRRRARTRRRDRARGAREGGAAPGRRSPGRGRHRARVHEHAALHGGHPAGDGPCRVRHHVTRAPGPRRAGGWAPSPTGLNQDPIFSFLLAWEPTVGAISSACFRWSRTVGSVLLTQALISGSLVLSRRRCNSFTSLPWSLTMSRM